MERKKYTFGLIEIHKACRDNRQIFGIAHICSQQMTNIYNIDEQTIQS